MIALDSLSTITLPDPSNLSLLRAMLGAQFTTYREVKKEEPEDEQDYKLVQLPCQSFLLTLSKCESFQWPRKTH